MALDTPKILNLMTVARVGIDSRHSAPRVEDQLRPEIQSTQTQDAARPIMHSYVAGGGVRKQAYSGLQGIGFRWLLSIDRRQFKQRQPRFRAI